MRTAFTIIIAGLSACGGVTTEPDAGIADAGPYAADDCKHSSTEMAQLSLGEGQLAHHVLDGEMPLTWEAGPQGGHHVWLSVRVKGLRQTGTVLGILASDDDDPGHRVLSNRNVIFSFRRDEGGFCTLSGVRLQLDERGDVELASLEGHHVRVAVHARDPEGSTADDEKVVQVKGPAVDAGP